MYWLCSQVLHSKSLQLKLKYKLNHSSKIRNSFFLLYLFLNVTMNWGLWYCNGIRVKALVLQSYVHDTQCVCHSVSPSLRSDSTCVGDGMLLPAGVSGGEGRGSRPRGDSWFTDCSGDRLQLLSSSHDELSSEAFGNGVSEGEGRGCWTREREKDWQMKK